MLINAGEVKTNSSSMFYYGRLHMDTPVLADQQKVTFIRFDQRIIERIYQELSFGNLSMVVRHIRLNKKQLFPNNVCFYTTVRMHHLQANLGVKRKGLTAIVQATSYIKQILEATSHKTSAVRPPTTHLKDHPN